MNKQQLASKIWESANQMRSKIEANEYKDYILGFIFYKYLSDKLVGFATDEGFTDEDFSAVTEKDTETVEHFKSHLGYFIAHKHLFSTWLDQTSDFDVADVREALSAFSRLINPNHKRLFEGIFKTLETGLSKLGDTAAKQTKAISDLLQLIKDIPMDGKQGYDVLGFIYEYLIGMFAANAGKKAGEFYTPHEVSVLMSEVIAHHLKGRKTIQIYDSTSGSGSLLLNIGQAIAKHMGSKGAIKYYAQELKENTYNLTRMNLVMRGIRPDDIVTRNADTLEDDCPSLKITALFDPHGIDDDESDDAADKAAGLLEIIQDYNATYGQKFDLAMHASFKRDLAARLAHKDAYKRIESTPEKQLDLLIVVNQMLTGFDSKWVNTLYCDKLLAYENVIQAFSRTNRLFGPDKPFGTIRYYRKPHTMKRNVAAAVKLYSGDSPFSLFAEKLPRNLERLNDCFTEISGIFNAAGVTDFAKLPDDLSARAAFAKQFNRFNAILGAAKIQGFTWNQASYEFDTEPKQSIAVVITKLQYLTLLQRYKELGTGGGGAGESIPFDIDSHITEIDTGKIDADYMNSRFAKYLKELQSGDWPSKEATLAELHRSFTSLSQEDQKFAEIFLHDIQRGDVKIEPDWTFRDYLVNYKARAKNKEFATIVATLGVDAGKLAALLETHVTEANLNEYGRFDDLRGTVDKALAKAYFERIEGSPVPPFKVKIRADNVLKDFLIRGVLSVETEPDTPGTAALSPALALHRALGACHSELEQKTCQWVVDRITESGDQSCEVDPTQIARELDVKTDEDLKAIVNALNVLSLSSVGILEIGYQWHDDDGTESRPYPVEGRQVTEAIINGAMRSPSTGDLLRDFFKHVHLVYEIRTAKK